jgi:uncharacterized peroxidase-related enzyme
MAWVRVVSEEEAKGDLAEAYARIRGARGRVANVIGVSSVLPEVMERNVDYYMALMYGSHKLPRAQREMIAVEVSRVNRCEYCVRHHAAALARVAKDPAFAAVRAAGDDAGLAAKDRALLAFARKLVLTSADTREADVQALRAAGWGDEEIVAAVHIVGYFSLMNRIVHGLGVDLEPDAGADAAYKY